MQVRGTFPDLTAGLTKAKRKAPPQQAPMPYKSVPRNVAGSAMKSLAQSAKQTAIVPKKRRQLTATAPNVGNAFSKLAPLVGRALKGAR